MGFQKAFNTVMGGGCAMQALVLLPILALIGIIIGGCFFCCGGAVLHNLLGTPTPTPF